MLDDRQVGVHSLHIEHVSVSARKEILDIHIRLQKLAGNIPLLPMEGARLDAVEKGRRMA